MAKNCIKSVGNLELLIVTLNIASIILAFVVLAVLARFDGISLWKLLRREELLVALGTCLR